ncbi:MAG: NAD(P)H-dependent oxidoreductase [Oceanospirillales bacterium]|nr:NAD(P)H-dependent oxidoreductase [Oceanospirillales bacterium]
MKSIVLINGNPKNESFCNHLADQYEEAAQQHASVTRFNLSAMHFDANLSCGYEHEQPLEPDLKRLQSSLLRADHIVMLAPIWWGGVPAAFKGLLDRILLPGVTFTYEEGLPVPLLRGKSARIILTMDNLPDVLQEQAAPVLEQLGHYTLQFCGVEPVQHTLFGSLILSSEVEREAWVQEIRQLGSSEAV